MLEKGGAKTRGLEMVFQEASPRNEDKAVDAGLRGDGIVTGTTELLGGYPMSWHGIRLKGSCA
jgi:hypothetical protein